MGLRTRSFTEANHIGCRTISRKGVTNLVAPTSWYMSSFLYRFYNGSSLLKIIPYKSSLVVQAYLQFNETREGQTLCENTDSFGQPVFEQLQSVSNSFEIRTPYYRGIRAEVVNSQSKPILGDVRTCVRINDDSETKHPSNMYEAAGDDFSFFFMVGPPPMTDIKNLKYLTTFPSGFPVEIDFTSATTDHVFSSSDSYWVAYPVKVVGSTTLLASKHYGIVDVVTGTKQFIMPYSDGTKIMTQIIDCFLLTITGSPPEIRFAM